MQVFTRVAGNSDGSSFTSIPQLYNTERNTGCILNSASTQLKPIAVMDNGSDNFVREPGSGEAQVISSSCAASSLLAANGSVLPPAADVTMRTLQLLVSIPQTVFGILLNGLVILLVFKFRRLQNASFGIAVQIVMVNLLLNIVIVPTLLNYIAGRWILGYHYCIITGFLSHGLAYTRGSLIVVFALDRFAVVFAPFNYVRYSNRTVIGLCTAFLCLSLANAIALIPPLLDCYIFDEATFICHQSSLCSESCSIYRYVYNAVLVAPAVIVPAVAFIALYTKARILRRQVSSMLGQKMKLKASDWRALKTFVLLLLPSVLLLLVLLFLILYLARSGSRSVGNIIVRRVYGNLYVLLLVIDPIIILRNTDVKECLGLLLKELKCCSSNRTPKRSRIKNDSSGSGNDKTTNQVMETTS